MEGAAMAMRFQIRSGWTLIIIATWLSFGHAAVAQVQREAEGVVEESPHYTSRPLGEMVGRDGTLRLEPGVRGSLDVTGWQMTTAPDGAPLFSSAASSDDNWQPGFNLAGTDGIVSTVVVDASGRLYIGGEFTVAHDKIANGVAMWDGTSWSALGSGMNRHSRVDALAVDGRGNLYAAGGFTEAGGVSANYIARWDGTKWSALGSGMNDQVYAVAVDGNGNLYAGGFFTKAGGVSARFIARWDGTGWSALGSGMNDQVYALAVDARHLYAGGGFTTAGDKVSAFLAHWIDSEVVSARPAAILPERLTLHQNYPNPFNPSTTIRFTLPEATTVRLAVYDLTGRAIRTLIDQHYPAGEHQAEWDGRDASGRYVASGVYLYRIETGGLAETRRMTFIK
jgi:hypothetical protein